jgi:hypothetical protein
MRSRWLAVTTVALCLIGGLPLAPALARRAAAEVVRAVACRKVLDAEPVGGQGKAGTFGPGPQRVCRFLEFAGVGGQHHVVLKAYLNGRRHSEQKDDFNDLTPNTSYKIWFCATRGDGKWSEEIFLDGKRIGGPLRYVVGAGGE